MFRQKRKALVTDIKVTSGCVDCGERHPACLHFHHLNPAEKVVGIAGDGYKMPIKKLMLEIAKCVVLCANCHAKRHYPAGNA